MRIEDLTGHETSSEELNLVEGIIQAFVKTRKVSRMYPSNNPVYINAFQTIYEKFQEFFTSHERLSLTIHQYRLVCKNEEVYYDPEKDDNLALFLFKDGIRELTFLRGLTKNELENFLKILNTDFEADAPDDDIVTLLWQENFIHIRYFIDDDFLDDKEFAHETAISDEALATAHQDALKQESKKAEILIDIYDIDLEYMAEQIKLQGLPKVQKIITIIFELLYQTLESTDATDVIQLVKETISYCVKEGDFKNITYILDMTRNALNDDSLGNENAKRLSTVFTFINSKVFIDKIGHVLDAVPEIDENDFIRYVQQLENNTIPFFLNHLGKLQTVKGRHHVINALVILGQRDIRAISHGLRDSKWHVVRNTALILGRISAPEILQYLKESLTHSDQRVRKEVVKAIGNVKSPDALHYLKNAFNDSDRTVRITAVRSFGALRIEEAKKILLTEIMNNNLHGKDFTEKKEFIRALANWPDQDVKDFLVKILKKKNLWRRTKHNEDKACAAYALGIIQDRNALALLEKTSKSKNRLLRRFSQDAIKQLKNHDEPVQ